MCSVAELIPMLLKHLHALVAMGHKITYVPLILKIRDIIFLFLGKLFYGPYLGPLKISLEMAHKVICRLFKISGTLIVITHRMRQDLTGGSEKSAVVMLAKKIDVRIPNNNLT